MYNVEKEKTFNARDEYERKLFAENIYEGTKNSEFYSPCLLDGKWGSGKTEFCHKLYNYIVDKNLAMKEDSQNNFLLIPIYINVFNSERIDNPFLTLMGGVVGSACNGITISPTLIEKSMAVLTSEVNIKSFLMAGTKDLLNIVLSNINKHIPELKENILEQIETGINSDIKSGIFENAFEEVNKLDQKYRDFTNELGNFATQTQPILFIIDELDRCRPDFAIKFLECVKHFFNVDNVYFLLSCNVDQLIASIEHLYGSKIDSENYLDKFFDDKISLKNNVSNHKANIKILTSEFEQFPFLDYKDTSITEYLFATTTLRTQKKILKKYQQIKSIMDASEYFSTYISMSLNKPGVPKITDIIIFSLAQMIVQNQKNSTITLKNLLSTDIFDNNLLSYIINIKIINMQIINDNIIIEDKAIHIRNIKDYETFLNEFIQKIII